MSRFLFVVQNGIGFGHLRRSLLLAQALEATPGEHRSLIISQASSPALLTGKGIASVNLPSLAHVSERETLLAYRRLLEVLIEEFEPDVLIEDTHPLPLLRQVEACRRLPRVLLVRRISPLALEEMRHFGELGWYQRILYMQSVTGGDLSQFGGPLHALFTLSPRFAVTGPIMAVATPGERAAIDAKYRRGADKLVVVSCGAGGDHDGATFTEQIFSQATQAAHRLAGKGMRARWLVVGGPYFKGRKPVELPFLEFIEFEPQLPALLQAADVVVARPGFNVVHETLGGRARLILIPVESFHETQATWCRELAACGDVHIVPLGGVAELAAAVEAEAQDSRKCRMPDGCAAAAEKIHGAVLAVPGAPLQPAMHLVLLPRTRLRGNLALRPVEAARFPSHSQEHSSGAGLPEGHPPLLWGGNVEDLTRDWIERQAPAVLLVDREDYRSWSIMTHAFGAEGRGILICPALVADAGEVAADVQGFVRRAATEEHGFALVIACEAEARPELLEAVIQCCRGSGIGWLTQIEFVARMIQQSYLSDVPPAAKASLSAETHSPKFPFHFGEAWESCASIAASLHRLLKVRDVVDLSDYYSPRNE